MRPDAMRRVRVDRARVCPRALEQVLARDAAIVVLPRWIAASRRKSRARAARPRTRREPPMNSIPAKHVRLVARAVWPWARTGSTWPRSAGGVEKPAAPRVDAARAWRTPGPRASKARAVDSRIPETARPSAK